MPHERIVTDPNIMLGKPVMRGTRITGERILRKLGAGMTIADIIAEHPHLTQADIQAAQAFATDYMADGEIAHR
ncbi:MAG: DUF433 domain-containing protein [Pseudomonadota bacterium]